MDSDKRFTHIATDPKFRRIPKGSRKVKIDKRFQSMFKDKKFNVKYTVDKRGRPLNHSTTEDLRRYYELSSEDSSEESHDVTKEKESYELTEESGIVSNSDSTTTDTKKIVVNQRSDSNKIISDDIKKKLKNVSVDYARGEGQLFSDSSSDEEDSPEEDVSETDEIDHKWGEMDNDAGETLKITSRLAACNMDWDRIRAVDLMVLFNSFLNSVGTIESIKIYPSEFGKKRMAEEDVTGPQELTQSKGETMDNEGVEGNKFHMEKLRQYQLNRLKYYYAVVICENNTTANKIYTECDGMEYESSSTKIDLRFIPEEMTFDDEPKEECNAVPETGKYKPRFFTTTALQQAKVDLTWDETNPDRVEVAQKFSSGKVDDISEADLQTYLACSSSEDENEEEVNEGDNNDNSDGEEEKGNPIDKYKALLQQIEDKEEEKKKKDVQMEVSWGINLKEKTDKLVKQKLAEKEVKTPFQEYLDKRKDKRKEKRKMKKQNDKGESSDDIPSDVDMNDPYFAEEFDKPEFKNHNSKKSNGKSSRIPEDDADAKRNQAELELLLEEDSNDKKHFSLKKIQDNETESKSKKKRNKKKELQEKSEDNFEIDVKDERFSALYTSHHYNIDPTDSHYKKTKAMETLISEKIKRRNNTDLKDAVKDVDFKRTKQNAELSVLVKSVKRKAGGFDKKKN